MNILFKLGSGQYHLMDRYLKADRYKMYSMQTGKVIILVEQLPVGSVCFNRVVSSFVMTKVLPLKGWLKHIRLGNR